MDQVLGQTCGGLRRPAQERHRVATGVGMDQFVESGEQIGLGLGARLHSCTRIPYPIRRLDARLHFRHGLDDGVAAHAGSFDHQCLRVWTAHPNAASTTMRRWSSFRCGSTTSKNRASASGATCTLQGHSARSIQWLTLGLHGFQAPR